MEQSVIDYIYYSDDEMRKQIETNVEFEALESRCNRLSEKLNALLTEEQKEVFKKYEDNMMEEYTVVSKMFFRKGVKVGIRIVAEGMFD